MPPTGLPPRSVSESCSSLSLSCSGLLLCSVQDRRHRQSYCADCGHIGASRVYDSGNDVTQILLVLLFVIPGVFYALWRRSMRYGGCRLCKSRRVMPLETPVAQEALRKMRAASSSASTDLSR